MSRRTRARGREEQRGRKQDVARGRNITYELFARPACRPLPRPPHPLRPFRANIESENCVARSKPTRTNFFRPLPRPRPRPIALCTSGPSVMSALALARAQRAASKRKCMYRSGGHCLFVTAKRDFCGNGEKNCNRDLWSAPIDGLGLAFLFFSTRSAPPLFFVFRTGGTRESIATRNDLLIVTLAGIFVRVTSLFQINSTPPASGIPLGGVEGEKRGNRKRTIHSPCCNLRNDFSRAVEMNAETTALIFRVESDRALRDALKATNGEPMIRRLGDPATRCVLRRLTGQPRGRPNSFNEN